MAERSRTQAASSGGGGGRRAGGGGGIPSEHIVAFIQAEVGKMKVELKSELETDIARLPTRGEFYGAIVAGIVSAFGIFSLMGDRVNDAATRSSTISAALERLAIQSEATGKALAELKDKEKASPEPVASPEGRKDDLAPEGTARHP